jgi:hypothetical protein
MRDDDAPRVGKRTVFRQEPARDLDVHRRARAVGRGDETAIVLG